MLLLLLLAPLSPEQRAIAFLEKQVPAWKADNHCYSCHNNGDAARALYRAARLGYKVAPAALADTTAWLSRPQDWDNNKGDPGFSDKRLARIQFAATLAEAMQAGFVKDRALLRQAAESLLPHQAADGSWPVEADANLGSPTTYGAVLATVIASQTFAKAGTSNAAADRWLAARKPASTMDAAALTLAGRAGFTAMIERAQNRDGGFGPYVNSPSEPFDTAIAMLALKDVDATKRGRAYLIGVQNEDGGWPETTRPSGSQSYAQRMSTSAWAALALIETSPDRKR